MTVKSLIECRRAQESDYPALQQLLEFYQYELSDIWRQRLDGQGRYGYDLSRFATNNSASAYVALAGGEYTGFALVGPAILAGFKGVWMEQFFIVKAHRRSGAGSALARYVFACHPGLWHVGEMAENLPAQSFLRSIVGRVAIGGFTERSITEGWWQGVVQSFRV